MKTNVLFVLAFFISAFAMAQDELFKVLVTKGDNKYIASATPAPQALIVGKKTIR